MRKTGITVFVWIFALAATLSATPAGTMDLAWDPVSDPDLAGYRVYYGTSPGSYTLTPVDVDKDSTSTTLSGLDACTRYYTAVKAFDDGSPSLESTAYSNEIGGLPRPVVGSTGPAMAEHGQTLTISIFGESFDTAPTVDLGVGITINSVQSVSCTELSANITITAGAATGSRDVTVVNPDSSFGTLTAAFTVNSAVAPTVSSATPADGATDVAVTSQSTVTFSEPMSAASITSSNVRLLDSAGQPVAQTSGSPQLSPDGLTATITPAADLANVETYQIHVRGAAGGVQDATGTAMAVDWAQNPGFTTIQAVDTQGPSVTGTTPADNAKNVSVNEQPKVTFDEAVDAASVTSGTVVLIDGTGASVPQASGSPTLSADGLTVTIVPAADLAERTFYKIRVVGGSGGVADAAGNTLDSTYEQASGFKTENLPPGRVNNHRRSDVH